MTKLLSQLLHLKLKQKNGGVVAAIFGVAALLLYFYARMRWAQKKAETLQLEETKKRIKAAVNNLRIQRVEADNHVLQAKLTRQLNQAQVRLTVLEREQETRIKETAQELETLNAVRDNDWEALNRLAGVKSDSTTSAAPDAPR